ncbi:MAG: plasmid pRiA4b ORF-3 family protein [Catenulispora sp.]
MSARRPAPLHGTVEPATTLDPKGTIGMSGLQPAVDDPHDVLTLPAVNAQELTDAIAAAPVSGWFRKLAEWAAPGRPMAGPPNPRVGESDMADLIRLLGIDGLEPDPDRAAAVADIAVRWAIQARLLRLRTGVVRTAKQNTAWLDNPATLWFQALSALVRPDGTLVVLLHEYTDTHFYSGDLARSVSEVLDPLAQGPADEQAIAREYGLRWGFGDARPAEIRVPLFLARALGLVTRDDTAGRWQLTAAGLIVHALGQLPRMPVDGEDDPDRLLSLVQWPDAAEPGFTVKVKLSRGGVWRRLNVPGELTVFGLHLAVQTAFGWHGDHLHQFSAGPFRFAPAEFELEETVPSDLVTVTDLATLGITDLQYEYDFGDSWLHEVTIERELPAGTVTAIVCTAGAGTTPFEDGEGWIEDPHGNYVQDPDAVPDPLRMYDAARINQELAPLTGEDDDSP